jgi:hypothetical protein
MKTYRRIAILILTATLAACGTTTNIKPSSTAEVTDDSAQKKERLIDLTSYEKVIVLDFVDATDKSKLTPDNARYYSNTLSSAVRSFPDMIAEQVRATGAFHEVVRGPSPGKAVSISGSITRLTEGSPALRLWIGMGAGSSYFDATTDISDAESGASIGRINVDKNSWPLGGIVASAQTVQTFMEGAAEKIAAQLRDSKKIPPVAKVH